MIEVYDNNIRLNKNKQNKNSMVVLFGGKNRTLMKFRGNYMNVKNLKKNIELILNFFTYIVRGKQA